MRPLNHRRPVRSSEREDDALEPRSLERATGDVRDTTDDSRSVRRSYVDFFGRDRALEAIEEPHPRSAHWWASRVVGVPWGFGRYGAHGEGVEG
jgi:hypothetical protein